LLHRTAQGFTGRLLINRAARCWRGGSTHRGLTGRTPFVGFGSARGFAPLLGLTSCFKLSLLFQRAPLFFDEPALLGVGLRFGFCPGLLLLGFALFSQTALFGAAATFALLPLLVQPPFLHQSTGSFRFCLCPCLLPRSRLGLLGGDLVRLRLRGGFRFDCGKGFRRRNDGGSGRRWRRAA
jgi:hypothetical protein